MVVFTDSYITMASHTRHEVLNHWSFNCLLITLCGPKSKKQRNIKVHIAGPLLGKFTVDRWIPRTQNQKRGKSFYLMTS